MTEEQKQLLLTLFSIEMNNQIRHLFGVIETEPNRNARLIVGCAYEALVKILTRDDFSSGG